MTRQSDLNSFYRILTDLEPRVGGRRVLRDCTGRSGWPQRGVYLFFEENEFRADSATPRVVRVGTHAVSVGSRATLWNRLRTHRGHGDGGGNHRGSIFRLRLGQCLLSRKDYSSGITNAWGQGSTAPKAIRLAEVALEKHVSEYIGRMPFLWLEIDDEPGPASERAYLERNSIALLSNYGKLSIDPLSRHWLGNASPEASIRDSGLWNTKHVADTYDPAFLDVFSEAVRSQ